MKKITDNEIVNDNEEDDDETRKVEGILAIKLGPDGVALKRNISDVMNNFFINYIVRSFTDCEKMINSKTKL